MRFGIRTKLGTLGAGIAVAVAVTAIATGSSEAAQPTADQSAQAAAASVQSKIVSYAKAIQKGHKEDGWKGGKVPYSWGGGHASKAHPSLGTCVGYTGSIHPCPADKTKGVDCSGFTRWVYKLAYGRDVLGAGNTNNQLARMHKVKHPKAGDLVFYGNSSTDTHHVGIYVGHGKMINALRTGTKIRTDSVNVLSDKVGYYHYS
jgi:cell wall-associated NlpC family hydrolase